MANEIWSGGTKESYGSGTVPKVSDTIRMLLVKRLLALIAQNGTVSANSTRALAIPNGYCETRSSEY